MRGGSFQRVQFAALRFAQISIARIGWFAIAILVYIKRAFAFTLAAMNHNANLNVENYQRMVQAIAFLRQHYSSQPDLAAIAQQVNLSEFHFQRLFTHWSTLR